MTENDTATTGTGQAADDIAKKLGLSRKTTMFTRFRPYLLWGGGALAVLAVALLVVNKRSSGKAPKFQTSEVTRGDLTVTVSATGTLQPTNQVDVGSEISGTLLSVHVDYNDRIKRGQVLARIDTTKLEAQARQSAASLEAARSRVLQAQATVSEAKAKFTRLVQVQEASGGKVPSKTEMDAARATLDRAIADEANSRSAVIQAEATLEAQRIDIAKSVIRSPINGIVLKRSADPGQTVAASFQTPVLFTLAEDLAQMELHVDVDEADVGKVQKSQGASFTVAAYPDRAFPARISQVRFGSKTVAGVVTYETVLTLDNSGLLLRPGMTGTASIIVQKVENTLLVPNTALRFSPAAAQTATPSSGGGSFVSKLFPRPPASSTKRQDASLAKQPHVWVQHDGQLQMIAVTTGMTDGIRTEVKGGKLTQGMSVVTDETEASK